MVSFRYDTDFTAGVVLPINLDLQCYDNNNNTCRSRATKAAVTVHKMAVNQNLNANPEPETQVTCDKGYEPGPYNGPGGVQKGEGAGLSRVVIMHKSETITHRWFDGV